MAPVPRCPSVRAIRTSIQKGALVGFGTLIALFLAELICRTVYTQPWYVRLLEDQERNNRSVSIHRNALGLRDRDYPREKPSRGKRVLILGDSFTFGTGVADDAAVFPELLENQLNAEFGAKTPIEILNGGIPGSLTHQWVELLSRARESFRPDVVLIVFFLRDGTRTGSMGSFFGPIRAKVQADNDQSFWYQNVYTWRCYRDYRDRQRLATKYARLINVSYLGDADQTQEWEKAKRNLLEIKRVAEAGRARVALVVFPILVELNHHYPFTGVRDVIVRFGVENQFPTHDLLPAFMGKNGPDLWVSAFDQHPNPVAHAIAAQSILPFLKQLLQPPAHDSQ